MVRFLQDGAGAFVRSAQQMGRLFQDDLVFRFYDRHSGAAAHDPSHLARTLCRGSLPLMLVITALRGLGLGPMIGTMNAVIVETSE